MADNTTKQEPGVYVLEDTKNHTRIRVVPERTQTVEQPERRTGQTRLHDSWSTSDGGDDV